MSQQFSIGLANKFVVFQCSPVQPTDDNPDPPWTNFAEATVSIEPISGRELLLSMQAQSSVSHRVKMWYVPGIDSSMRIVWGSRILGIDSVINVGERNRVLELSCQEVLDI